MQWCSLETEDFLRPWLNSVCVLFWVRSPRVRETALLSHRGAEVVSDLMSEGDVRDFRRHVRGVVLHRDDPGVQRLLLPVRIQLVLLTDSSRAPWETHTHSSIRGRNASSEPSHLCWRAYRPERRPRPDPAHRRQSPGPWRRTPGSNRRDSAPSSAPELLHADVSEAEGVGAVALVAGGVYLSPATQDRYRSC